MSAILLALATVSQAPAATPPKRCAKPAVERAEARRPLQMRKLGDMPPARQIKGVFNEVDGCPAPIVVRDSVGLPGR